VLRVVADTNVYIISALNFGGVPDQVLALARRGRIDRFVSKPTLEEIEGVLNGNSSGRRVERATHWQVSSLLLSRRFGPSHGVLSRFTISAPNRWKCLVFQV